MNATNKYANAENALILIFLSAGLYGYIEAGNFTSDAATFPQLVSGIIVFLGVLLLLRNFLPEWVESMIFKEASLGQSTDDNISIDETKNSSTETDSADETIVKGPKEVIMDDRVIISGLGFVYLALGYLIGLLWATPVFMFLYMLSQRQPWHTTLVMIVIGTGIVYGFQWGIGLELDQGILL